MNSYFFVCLSAVLLVSLGEAGPRHSSLGSNHHGHHKFHPRPTANPSKSRCHNVSAVENFNLEKFSKIWYGVAKSSPSVQRGLKCNFANISAINSTHANYTGAVKNVWTNKPKVLNTLIYQKYKNLPGILAIGSNSYKFTSNYTIIDVDYSKYAILHVCARSRFSEHETAFVVSRDGTLDKTTLDEGKQKLQTFGINTDHFTVIDQLNC